jgi:hypothetical protein
MLDDHIVQLAIAITDRIERFTPQDKMAFSAAMVNCPCLCARTMKDVLMPSILEQALKGGIISFKKTK